LGAQSGDVLRSVVGHGIALAAIGAAIGTAASFGVTRFLGSMLYDVKPSDPLTLVSVTVLLLLVALAACYIPARRATRVDPLVALRYE
jgi:putative ABC transport system permease protein